MGLILLDAKNPQCISRSSVRTVQGAVLESLNLEEPAVAQAFQSAIEEPAVSKNSVELTLPTVPSTPLPTVPSTPLPDPTGSGINLFGNGISLFGRGLVPVCHTTPEYLQQGMYVMHGKGIGSWFKKTGNRVLSWSKENMLPILLATAREAVKSGKRIGADVLAETAPHLATVGAQAIDKKFGNSLVGNVAQQGLALAGKTAQKRASDYVASQGKAYSSTENRIADEIAKRSLAELSKLQAKKSQGGKGLPNRYIQDRVLN